MVIFDNLSTLEHVREIRRGYALAHAEKIRTQLGLTEGELSNMLGISLRTYRTRKNVGHLNKKESELLYRFCILNHLAEDVLQSKEHAQIWLRTPKKALNGETPYQFCDTSPGYQEVRALLGRIEHGVYS